MTPIERARHWAETIGNDDMLFVVHTSELGEICRALIAAEERVAELERALRGVIRESDRNTDAYIYARSLLS